ncbi:hypothetical protein R1sor_019183 [Riccia sorocarpa]|uniref:Uncharacterized protein n=1 Tax=Riccia sorocarpa TaxID=122646 RepID=A0ABD3ICX5_9MARC
MYSSPWIREDLENLSVSTAEATKRRSHPVPKSIFYAVETFGLWRHKLVITGGGRISEALEAEEDSGRQGKRRRTRNADFIEMAKQSGATMLGLEVAPPRIITVHRRVSSEIRLDTILEDNPLVTFSEQNSPGSLSGFDWESSTSSPTVRQQRFRSELSRLARFPQ